jgi:tetratricopeptide (TPR) repeat protein
MMRATAILRAGFVICLSLVGALVAHPGVSAAAQPDVENLHEADKHFQQGVMFYGEADYHAALVEFNRAYALAPNDVVLFNIGETQYQLREYAGALATFEHFLAAAAPGDPHRAVAENNVKELRSRVGRLTIATVPSGVEITIDGRVIGKSPIENPVVVGVGQVTVKGTAPGRAPVARTIEVAAEDDISMLLELQVLPAGGPGASQAPGLSDAGAGRASGGGAGWRVAGWITTGLLAGGAATFGLLARKESKDLQAARAVYPADGPTLTRLANRTNTYSIAADSITAAALVVGGITLYSTLSAKTEVPSTRVSLGLGPLGLGSLALDVAF